jgi:hypothetical protein
MISPTNHQARGTYDTIFALTANPFFGKLYFYVIISSVIDPKLKSHPQMICILSLRFVEFVQIEDYIIPGDSFRLKVM